MFEFGKRREVMSQEPKDQGQEKSTPQAGRAAKREVELFPGLGDRRAYPMAPVAAGGGTRLGTHINLFQPSSFEEALEIVECLRARSATTITLDKMKKVDAGRLVDFVTGASAALDGDFHKLTEQVYVFCPSNIRIVASGKIPVVASGLTRPTNFGGGPLDFLFPESSSDRSGLTGMWSKS